MIDLLVLNYLLRVHYVLALWKYYQNNRKEGNDMILKELSNVIKTLDTSEEAVNK